MATENPHNDIKRISELLVNSIHLVKSPANKKRFFLMKGEGMSKEKLKERLRSEDLSDDEIELIMTMPNVIKVLSDSDNEKRALQILQEGIKESIGGLENALESGETISDLTEKLVKPFEQLAELLEVKNDKKTEDKDDSSEDNKDSNDDANDKNNNDELPDDVAQMVDDLIDETTGLIEDVIEFTSNQNDNEGE